jgi:hypothetical protein
MFGERNILALGDTHGGALIKNSGLDYFLVSSDIDTLGYSIKFYIWITNSHDITEIVLKVVFYNLIL